MDYVPDTPLLGYCDAAGSTSTPASSCSCRSVTPSSSRTSGSSSIATSSPDNILVTDDGTPRLLDFGIAKLLAPEAACPRAR